MHKILILAIFFFQLTCNKDDTPPIQKPTLLNYINLLEGNSLDQFEIKGGTAEYTLEDGILTGIADKDIPNTFLTTKKQYENFILNFYVKVDPRLNSGVQIRSEFVMDGEYEMLKGYQVEIDPSERAWSGGIYEERNRGWIANLSKNEKGRSAFKNNGWNNYYVEAIDDQIRVWVNGINTTNLLDSLGKKGHIGFQVHSIYDDAHVGAKVQWKDISLTPNPNFGMMFDEEDHANEINLLVNQLSEYEMKNGWKLFEINKLAVPFDLDPWRLNENCLCGQGETMSDLDIAKLEGDFELRFEYKIEQGGSATFAYEQDKNGNDDLSYSIADDQNIEELKAEDSAGSITGKIQASNLSNKDRAKALRNFNQWSQAEIVVKNNKIQHWLNNNLVVETELIRKETFQRNLRFRTKGSRLCVRSIKYRPIAE